MYFQTNAHNNISDNIAILVLLCFDGWYVWLWRLEMLDELCCVEWLFSSFFYLFFWCRAVLLFLFILLVDVLLIINPMYAFLLLILVLIFLLLLLLFGWCIHYQHIHLTLFFFVILDFLKFFIIDSCDVDIFRINLLQNLLLSVAKIYSYIGFCFIPILMTRYVTLGVIGSSVKWVLVTIPPVSKI